MARYKHIGNIRHNKGLDRFTLRGHVRRIGQRSSSEALRGFIAQRSLERRVRPRS